MDHRLHHQIHAAIYTRTRAHINIAKCALHIFVGFVMPHQNRGTNLLIIDTKTVRISSRIHIPMKCRLLSKKISLCSSIRILEQMR